MSRESDDQSTGAGAVDDMTWAEDGIVDPITSSIFTQELANIDESDWDVDSDLLWGDDSDVAIDSGPDPLGPDLLA